MRAPAADISPTPVLWAHQLQKQYAGAPTLALDRFEITVNPGEIVGILGPNGAGKTTCISILSTLMPPTAGSVHICGVNALKHPQKIRALIGLAPQEIALYLRLTARENLTFWGRLYGLSGKLLKLRVAEALEFVNLADNADRRLDTFSGGMKRRINLAAGLINRPRLLFLDEPTVGIDTQSRNMILEKLEILREAGTAMIYTTHYMEEAERLCTQVAVLDEGKIIAGGKPAQLLEDHPAYQNLGELFLGLTGKQLRE